MAAAVLPELDLMKMIGRILWPVLVIICLFGLGWCSGSHHQEVKDLQGQIENSNKVNAAYATLAAGVDRMNQQSAARAAQVEATNQSIAQEFRGYAKTHPNTGCVLDADGLRLWRAGNAGTASTGSSRSASVPSTAGPGERSDERPAGESSGRNGDLSPLPGTPPRLGELGQEGRRWNPLSALPWLEQAHG